MGPKQLRGSVSSCFCAVLLASATVRFGLCSGDDAAVITATPAAPPRQLSDQQGISSGLYDRSSDEGPACQAELLGCAAARAINRSACRVCVGHAQHALQSAGCSAAAVGSFCDHPHIKTNEWYVSAAVGNDEWSGRMQAPNAAKNDGPVATIARAAELVRARGDRTRAATVNVAAGWYPQTEPVVFGQRDAGRSETSRVTWKGTDAPEGPPILSFGTRIGAGAQWQPVGGGIWQLQLPAGLVTASTRPRQMWHVSAEPGSPLVQSRMTRSRRPNSGSNFVIPLGGTFTNGFTYQNGDLNPAGGLGNLSEVEVVVYASWCTSRHHIKQLNTSQQLAVSLTGSGVKDMWPNSGNRYYLENSLAFVDDPEEWYVSESGLLTFRPPKTITDPSTEAWILDKGDGLKTGLQIKESSVGKPQVLLPEMSDGEPAIVMPAAEMNFAAANWTLTLNLTVPAGRSGLIFVRGPHPFTHVPGDTTFAVQPTGNLMMDFGWQCNLVGRARINDGQVHQIAVQYSNKQLTLTVDGKNDAQLVHSLGINSGKNWMINVSVPAGSKLEELTFAASHSQNVGYISLENLAIAHVGWSTFGNMQSASFLDSAAVHLHNVSAVTLKNISIKHVGGYALWVEGSSHDVSINNAVIDDVSGGVRIGRGNPLSAEPIDQRTSDVTIHNCRIRGGALVYREAAGVLVQNADAVSLTHSEVSYFNHVGVSFGWVWGFSPRSGRDNRITFNHVHHVGNHDLSDLGGIYMLGVQPNSIVRGNVVHE